MYGKTYRFEFHRADDDLTCSVQIETDPKPTPRFMHKLESLKPFSPTLSDPPQLSSYQYLLEYRDPRSERTARNLVP